MAEKIDIDQQLNLLIQLQGIDGQIYRLNAEKEIKPHQMQLLKDTLAQRESTLRELETNLKNLQVKRKEKEIELETEESRIKKLQMQLYQLKSNKEYSAMLHEIESQKADKSLLEDEVLKIMEAVDIADAKVKQGRDSMAQEAKKIEVQIKTIEDEIKKIEDDLFVLKTKRDGLTPSLNPSVVKDYEKILAGKEGLALVEVISDTCGGCYMHLPPQVINEIKMKEHFIFCESCRRILYIKDEQT